MPNVELILDIAKRVQVDAVWAGWGHASENPKLPEMLHKNGIAFIGKLFITKWPRGLADGVGLTLLLYLSGVTVYWYQGDEHPHCEPDIIFWSYLFICLNLAYSDQTNIGEVFICPWQMLPSVQFENQLYIHQSSSLIGLVFACCG